MSDLLHALIERYGLVAVFVACLAEGETAALLAGFMTHQDVFSRLPAFATIFAASFAGDTGFFLAGRYFSGYRRIAAMRTRPGFSKALGMIARHPNAYILLNRFAYGLRAVGAITAGMSDISASRFVLLNALACAVWAASYITLGYVFGLGIERLVGTQLLHHERLLAAGALLVVSLIIAFFVSRRVRGRRDPESAE